MKNVVGFGEIMLRLSPPDNLRFTQSSAFEAYYGGAEANVITSLAQWDIPTLFVTRLSENELGDVCLQNLRRYGVNTSHILRSKDRLGIYFCENGASLRPSQVIYDRENSAFSSIQPGMVDWESIFINAKWFHWTGVTPAISKNAYLTLLEAIKVAREHEVVISCDINFRSKLWQWGKKPQEILPELVNFVDVFLGNEEDMKNIFNITIPEVHSKDEANEKEKFVFLSRSLTHKFPQLTKITITKRISISASRNLWSAVYWDGTDLNIGTQYDINPIVDRVGGGDSFAAGLIFGLLNWPQDSQKVLEFALAASALKHTIKGDYNQVSLDEINEVLAGSISGRIAR